MFANENPESAGEEVNYPSSFAWICLGVDEMVRGCDDSIQFIDPRVMRQSPTKRDQIGARRSVQLRNSHDPGRTQTIRLSPRTRDERLELTPIAQAIGE